MADTSIEWAEKVWNPTTGCDKVSPGCDNCYAMTMAKRLKGMGSPKYQTDGDARTSGPGFGIAVHPDVLTDPLGWAKPRKIFVNSMSDLFHDSVPDDFIARVFAVMAMTPHHTYQLLTKRHGRMRSLLGRRAADDLLRESFADEIARQNVDSHIFDDRLADPDFARRQLRRRESGVKQYDRHAWPGWPLPNVWIGVSVEDQKRADLRVPALLDTPAAVRFLSCEPLLGPINLRTGRYAMGDGETYGTSLDGIDWVIVGGESGPKARPMHPQWARSLRDQCQSAGVAYHFKQHGAWVEVGEGDVRSTDLEVCADGYAYPLTEPHDRPDGSFCDDGTAVTMRRVGKGAAGRVLDGRTWDEFPERAA